MRRNIIDDVRRRPTMWTELFPFPLTCPLCGRRMEVGSFAALSISLYKVKCCFCIAAAPPKNNPRDAYILALQLLSIPIPAYVKPPNGMRRMGKYQGKYAPVEYHGSWKSVFGHPIPCDAYYLRPDDDVEAWITRLEEER